jgi:hypothetical protein
MKVREKNSKEILEGLYISLALASVRREENTSATIKPHGVYPGLFSGAPEPEIYPYMTR